MLILCITFFSGCSKKGAEYDENVTAAVTCCEELLDSLIEGDKEAVNQHLFMPELYGDLSNLEENGIITNIMNRMTYDIVSGSKEEDSILVKMRIQSIDIEKLFESISEDVDSEEAAKKELLANLESAKLKKFDVELTVLQMNDEYKVLIGNDFVNAITGGLYDVALSIYEEENGE